MVMETLMNRPTTGCSGGPQAARRSAAGLYPSLRRCILIAGFSRRLIRASSNRGFGAPAWDFKHHYSHSHEPQYEEALAELRKGVRFTGFAVPSPLAKSEPQITWDLQAPPELRWHKPEWEPRMVEVPQTYHEVCPCYRPFHAYKAEGGIYLWPKGVAACASAMKTAVTEVGGSLTDRAAVVWARHMLFWHEVVHNIVEDVVSFMELQVEDYGIFERARKRWGDFIVMEEAIANSLAFSMQSDFFKYEHPEGSFEALRRDAARNANKDFQEEPEPDITLDLMLSALEAIIRASPVGYRDFADWGSRAERLFLENLTVLIQMLYMNPYDRWDSHRNHFHYDSHKVDEVIRVLEKAHGDYLHPWLQAGSWYWREG